MDEAAKSPRLQELLALLERGREMLASTELEPAAHKAWASSVNVRLQEVFGKSEFALPWASMRMNEDPVVVARRALTTQIAHLTELLSNESRTLTTATAPGAREPDLLDHFISHSSEDSELAEALYNLLRAAMEISPKRIRCTSVAGAKLEGGSDYEEQLRTETKRSTVFTALITPNSIRSTFTMFEVGARWYSGKRMFPILGRGMKAANVGRPLSSLTLVNGTSRDEMLDFVHAVAAELSRPVHAPSTWSRHLDRVLELAKNAAEQSASPAIPPATRDPRLLTDGLMLLAEAGAGGGMITRVTNGVTKLKIQAHRKTIEVAAGKERAYWEAVLREIVSAGFVEQTAPGVFRMTKAGYDAVDTAKNQQPVEDRHGSDARWS